MICSTAQLDDSCGFDRWIYSGASKRGMSGKHFGVNFGNCNIPTKKDHDRLGEVNVAPAGETDGETGAGPLLYAFTLCDGHGLSSAVSDLATDHLVKTVSRDPRWENAWGAPPEEGVATFIKCAEEILTHAFEGAHAAAEEEFKTARVGSTATAVVLSRPALSQGGPSKWRVAVAWVGDSRAVLVPRDKAAPARDLTDDHRTDLPRERERLLKAAEAEAGKPKGLRRTVVAHRVCDTSGRVSVCRPLVTWLRQRFSCAWPLPFCLATFLGGP
mmetsp:Transcript_14272/g.33781  ORF Transcript_14272/g.33781 Transcript_14272/m.33781 type:complete len:272 (-) Transcript_14272:323-1138(-)